MNDSSRAVMFSVPYEIAALLVPDRQRIAESLNRDIANLADDEIEAALWWLIERVSGRLERYAQIRKIAVIRDDFPSEVRSINHFHKVKVDRKVVAARYQREIAAIYSTVAIGGMH